VRLDRLKADPLRRHLVPSCHDKAFFCSSRVPPLNEWNVAMNLDWYVERGLGKGREQLDGGRERLVASVIILRKSYYYSQHYIFILFLMTSTVFLVFTVPLNEIEARSSIIFSLLLTVVAFNYSIAEDVPKVPYATILESYIYSCFVTVLVAGATTFLFSWLFTYSNDPYIYDEHSGDVSRDIGFIESIIGWGAFAIWALGNYFYWSDMLGRIDLVTHAIAEDEQLGWLKYKSEDRKFSVTGFLKNKKGADTWKARFRGRFANFGKALQATLGSCCGGIKRNNEGDMLERKSSFVTMSENPLKQRK